MAHLCPTSGVFSDRCNSGHRLAESGVGAPRPRRSHGRRTRVGSIRDAIAALAHSDAALAGPELRTALADPNIRAAVADPGIKVPLAEPEVNVRRLEVSDECVLSEEG